MTYNAAKSCTPRESVRFRMAAKSPPAALFLQRLREVPMVEAEPRRTAARDQPIDQTRVESVAALLDGAAAGRQNARPRHRKPISGKISACEQIDIVAPAVVVAAGEV